MEFTSTRESDQIKYLLIEPGKDAKSGFQVHCVVSDCTDELKASVTDHVAKWMKRHHADARYSINFDKLQKPAHASGTGTTIAMAFAKVRPFKKRPQNVCVF